MNIPKRELLIKLYYKKEYTIRMIAKHFNVSDSTPNYWFRKYKIKRRSIGDACRLRDKLRRRNYEHLYTSKENHPNWKGGRIENNGYISLRIPTHHRARKNGYVFEHIVNYEMFHNVKVKRGIHIHHIDGDKKNNDVKNLILLTPQEHINVIPSLLKEISELKKEILELRSNN